MEFWSLLLSITQSCVQILLVCVTGYVCAYMGMVTPTVQKGLSKLIVAVLLPCYLFTEVAVGIDIDTLIRLWPIAAFMGLYAVLGSTIGWVGGKILGTSKKETNFIITGIVFNNLTSLSVSLLNNIEHTPAVQYLLIDEDDIPADAIRRGISFALLASLLGNFLRKSISTIFKNMILKIVTSIREIMNPPLYAAVLAVIVGTIPTLKNLFFGHNAILYPTITKTMITLGNLSIPITLLLLGTQLNNSPPTAKDSQLFPTIGWVMASRFLFVPIFGISLVYLTRTWYSYYDPMLWFVLMLLSASPTAVNCINLTQLTGTFQEEMSTLLFYSYVLTAPILTFLIMIMILVIQNAKLS
ncbi:6703_t:CDS:2 [Ambispora gerdemannii]|uniref:6703_t:CDS:1 n=1 Tax=Ambispora gerdemannii TaxID=144530 RepID=A0A9N8ZFC0_9GLOM|nr:6703_t:CDS:2 [Ambispora gerdemannii]